ncbi:hypothetical protein A6770_40160 [Nostoc minutum NIES-26]|uniref:Uncharacterized protein n=1 Tax=Nostoc minutum NIES-26 TaxID=1844469 RepID=A0A367RP05_9NOSO|nr:hypothetical protein A6770_40160 [Nostoc minutum NIES-26]
MKQGVVELALAGVCGVAAIMGLATSQTRQPYDLTQIQFCPRSANDVEGQVANGTKKSENAYQLSSL